MAKREGITLPMRFEFLHDDREGFGGACDDPCTGDLRRPWASV